jgi:hypothetical protein
MTFQLVTEGNHLLGIGQDAGPAMEAGLQGKGTPQVEVGLAIALRSEEDKEGPEFLGTGGDELGHEGHPGVMLGGDVAQVLGAELAFLLTDEGGVIGVHSAKQLMVERAPRSLGVALQRGS